MNRFDAEAERYDARTGIPLEKRPEIVRSLSMLSGAAAGDVLLELGAGTGQLGACFSAAGLSYVGLDASAPLLEVFPRRLPAGAPPVRLIHADAGVDWDVETASVRAVFSSRAVHWFDLGHVVHGTLRVALPGAAFVLGRVQREDRSVRSLLRREMRAMLSARGLVPRDGNRGQRRVLDAFRARGATPLGPMTAATWPDRRSARNVLDAWRDKPGLGGCEPPAEIKAAVLADLQAWAAERFGALDAPHTAEESYVLEGVRLPPG